MILNGTITVFNSYVPLCVPCTIYMHDSLEMEAHTPINSSRPYAKEPWFSHTCHAASDRKAAHKRLPEPSNS